MLTSRRKICNFKLHPSSPIWKQSSPTASNNCHAISALAWKWMQIWWKSLRLCCLGFWAFHELCFVCFSPQGDSSEVGAALNNELGPKDICFTGVQTTVDSLQLHKHSMCTDQSQNNFSWRRQGWNKDETAALPLIKSRSFSQQWRLQCYNRGCDLDSVDPLIIYSSNSVQVRFRI